MKIESSGTDPLGRKYNILRLDSSLDHNNVVELLTIIDKHNLEDSDLILNCVGLTQLDASGLGAFVSMYIFMCENGNEFSCVNLYGQPFNLLKTLKLTTFLERREKCQLLSNLQNA